MTDHPSLFFFAWYLIFGALLRFKRVRVFLSKIGMGEEALMLFMSKLMIILGFVGFFVYWITGSARE